MGYFTVEVNTVASLEFMPYIADLYIKRSLQNCYTILTVMRK